MKTLQRICRRLFSRRIHWARTWLRWLIQFAIPLVKPPTAAPVRAASAEMMDTSTGATPCLSQNAAAIITEPCDYYDADERGPSEIRRELRCPVRYDQTHCV